MFKEARTSNEIGQQVCAASVFGQMGSPGVAGYCASKAAVIGLVRTAAKENPQVRMNCVAPGKFNHVHTLPCVSDSPVFLHSFHFQAILFFLAFCTSPPLFFRRAYRRRKEWKEFDLMR